MENFLVDLVMSIVISDHFSAETIARAEHYVLQGHVLSVETDSASSLSGRVKNGRGDVYYQTLHIDRVRGQRLASAQTLRRKAVSSQAASPPDRIKLSGSCSCAMHYNCKHVAAVLIAFSDSSLNHTAHKPSSPELRRWLSQAASLATQAVPLEARPVRSNEYPKTVKDRLIYVVDSAFSNLRIEVYRGQINAQRTALNQTLRRHDILHHLRSAATLPAYILPVDLDLLGQLAEARLLVGQGAVFDKVPAALQRPFADGEALLRALSQTGRLFHEARTDAVLRWSDIVCTPTLGWVYVKEQGQHLAFVKDNGSDPSQTLQVPKTEEGSDKPVGSVPGEPADQAVDEPSIDGATRLTDTQSARVRFTAAAAQLTPIDVKQLGDASFWIDPAAGQIGRMTENVAAALVQFVRNSPRLRLEDLSAAQDLLPPSVAGLKVPAIRVPQFTRQRAVERHVQLMMSAASARQVNKWYAVPMKLAAMSLRFVYDGHIVDGADDTPIEQIIGTDIVVIERDPDWELDCFERLQRVGAIPVYDLKLFAPSDDLLAYDFVFVDGELNPFTLRTSRLSDALQFMLQSVPQLRSEGWQVEITPKWPLHIAEAKTEFVAETRIAGAGGARSKGQGGSDKIGAGANELGWFDLGFLVEINGRPHDVAPLIAAFVAQVGDELLGEELPTLDALVSLLSARMIFVEQGKGYFVPVDLTPLAPVLYLFLSYQHDASSPLHPFDATIVGELETALTGSEVRFFDHAGILPLASRLAALQSPAALAPPRTLQADLRPYQAFGTAWMQCLVKNGFGGVLADDMGLGKTVQLLALLLARREQGETQGPSLLIVPTSLLHSWQNQAAQFAPDLKLLILHGATRKGLFGQIEAADLVITTYPLLVRDEAELVSFAWDLVILDEAQTLKNPASQAAKALRELGCNGRLALTGTPMENSLQDLWTLFDWVVPGLLGNRKTFQTMFRTPIEKHADKSAQSRLNRRLRPFLLRRTKDDVLSELPPRTEILERVELTKSQQALYETVRATMDVRVRQMIAVKGLAASRITILDALMKLRQVCCDPALVKTEMARSVTDSAKRRRLRELVEQLVAEGRRVLVFSQFVTMLDLIAEDLRSADIAYLMLTGQTRNRADVLNEFAQGSAPVFLLSLKAGGVGLTLTQADTVILYDPWWNPAVERQAMDRAHRIGQDKPVFVHRLVAAGTVEEKILALQAKKQALADALFADGTSDEDVALLDEVVLADLFAPLGIDNSRH